jgi:hypothetical protein
MKTNNYNTSTEKQDIEFVGMMDCDIARIYFEEQFKVIQHDGYRDRAVYEYLPGCGESKVDSLSDLFDMGKITRKQFRQFAIENIQSENMTFQDLVYDMFQCYGNWKDYVGGFLAEQGWNEIAREGMPDLPHAKYDLIRVAGYCQGDYAYILVPLDCEYEVNRDYLENIIFSAPVYARLDVDGEELDLVEFLSDNYSWDKVEVIEGLKKAGQTEFVLQWCGENLPEGLDYA